MRHTLTLARAHGDAALRIVSDNTVPFTDQLKAFKAINTSRSHPHIAEVQIWQSDKGIIKRVKFTDPAAPKPAAEPPELPAETAATKTAKSRK